LVTEPVQIKLFNLREEESGNLDGNLGGNLDNQGETYNRKGLRLVSDNSPKVLTKNLTNKDTIKEISKKDDDYISKFQNIRDNKERHTVKRYSQLTAEERSNIEFEVYTSLASLNKKQFEHILKDVTKQATKLLQDGKEIYNYETYLFTACNEYMKNYVLKVEEEEAYKELMLEAVGESPNAFDDRNKEPKIDYSKIF
ncbi:hypothetical protein, partial [Listeria monocytogenes]